MATFLRSRATFQLIGQSTPCLITHYWDSTGAAIGLLATEALARDRAFFNSLAAFINAGAVYAPLLTVDEIEETTGALVNQVTGSAPAAITFAGATDNLPYAVQGLIRFGTNSFVSGRRVQGRMFVPGLTESSSAGTPPAPTAGAVTAMNTAAALLGTTVVTAMTQRVWHRPAPGRPGLSVPVINRAAATTWAILKSRRT